jgi:hypothetical protein
MLRRPRPAGDVASRPLRAKSKEVNLRKRRSANCAAFASIALLTTIHSSSAMVDRADGDFGLLCDLPCAAKGRQNIGVAMGTAFARALNHACLPSLSSRALNRRIASPASLNVTAIVFVQHATPGGNLERTACVHGQQTFLNASKRCGMSIRDISKIFIPKRRYQRYLIIGGDYNLLKNWARGLVLFVGDV